jgi:hypothetical protein
MAPGVTVHPVDAGPPHPLPKDDLLPYMARFGARLRAHWSQGPPDVVHAQFWMPRGCSHEVRSSLSCRSRGVRECGGGLR